MEPKIAHGVKPNTQNRSYVDVVKGLRGEQNRKIWQEKGTGENWSGMEYKVKPKEYAWLEGSYEEYESWSTVSDKEDHEFEDTEGWKQDTGRTIDEEKEEDDVASCRKESNGKIHSQDSKESEKTVEAMPDSLQQIQIVNDGEHREETEKATQRSGNVKLGVSIDTEKEIQLGLVGHIIRKQVEKANNKGGCSDGEESIIMGQAQESFVGTSLCNDTMKAKIGKLKKTMVSSDEETRDSLWKDLEINEGYLED
ncbi:hypothetical protein SLEP1_g36896 [Rubroshorea leprosula]|uniref:Uncharacterized protein n=1 Tax=Rubroshorea leprosula TaxID=152421 RepID=A0AAV5KSZ9_9ROSI|nr:hypothetical protein SLEP1_g36896 [Rubroshorea leprosula]